METMALAEPNKSETQGINGCTDALDLAAICLKLWSCCCGSIGPAITLPFQDASTQTSAKVLSNPKPSSPPPTVHKTLKPSLAFKQSECTSSSPRHAPFARFTTYPQYQARAEIASESS